MMMPIIRFLKYNIVCLFTFFYLLKAHIFTNYFYSAFNFKFLYKEDSLDRKKSFIVFFQIGAGMKK